MTHCNDGLRCPSRALAVLLLVALAGPASAEVVVRRSVSGVTGANAYESDLTRAYEACTAPNDASSDGILACSPPITSACDFDSGTIRLRSRAGMQIVELTAQLRDVGGPGSCATGPYTLDLLLRVSVDDATCTGGTCTFIDVPLSHQFTGPSPSDRFDIDAVNLETILNGIVAGIDLDDANYEVLAATVMAPDNLPMAAAGVGSHSARDFYTNLGASYPACDVPNTTDNVGIPACGPIAWTPVCDLNAGNVKWHDVPSGQPEVSPQLFDLAGSSPDCTTGAYDVESTLRITTADCGGAAVPCTLVDTPVVVAVTPTKNDVAEVTLPFAASGITGPIDSFEVRGVRVLEPAGTPLLSAAVSNAWRVGKPKVTVGRKKLDVPNDDQIKVMGRMLQVPPVDPTVAPGATITISDHTGPIYTATIPAGLWEAPGLTSWRYKDKTGAIAGVRKATIKLGSSSEGDGYLVKLQATGLDLSAVTYPGVDIVLTVAQQGGGGTITAKGNRTCKVGTKTLTCK